MMTFFVMITKPLFIVTAHPLLLHMTQTIILKTYKLARFTIISLAEVHKAFVFLSWTKKTSIVQIEFVLCAKCISFVINKFHVKMNRSTFFCFFFYYFLRMMRTKQFYWIEKTKKWV